MSVSLGWSLDYMGLTSYKLKHGMGEIKRVLNPGRCPALGTPPGIVSSSANDGPHFLL